MTYTLQTFSLVNPVVSTSPAYTSGDNVGGKLTFTSVFVTSKMAGLLSGILITDKAKQVANMDLILFSEDPTGTTFTDNSAQAIADADLTKIIGVFNLATHCSLSDNSITYGSGLSESIYSTCGGSLYGCLVVRATPTYAATTDLSVRIDVLQDS